MRLSKQQLQIIENVAAIYLSGSQAKLYLYGSRTDANTINDTFELLLVAESDTQLYQLQLKKYRIISELKSKLDFESIELSIITQPQSEQPSYQMALSSAICLH